MLSFIYSSVLVLEVASLLVSHAPAQAQKVVESKVLRMTDGEPFIPALPIIIGTPPQNIIALLDTGSSDLWVPQTGSKLCQDPLQQCTTASSTGFTTGSFDPNKSATFSTIQGAPKFFTNYQNGVVVNGSFMQESVQFGNTTVPSLELGLATVGVLPNTPLFPIAGLGYSIFEGIIQTGDKPYENTVAAMKTKGMIKSTSFGLYLNDFRADEGSIVFGGFDSAKFGANLTALPLSPDSDGVFRTFFVPWKSLTFQPGGSGACKSTVVTRNNRSIGNRNRKNSRSSSTENNASKTSPVNLTPSKGLSDALLDSGNPTISLESPVVSSIAKAIGTTVVNGALDSIPCTSGDSGAKFVMGFANKLSIEVPLSMILLPAIDQAGPITDDQGNALCNLPIEAVPDTAPSALGSPFLQAAYVVFDMDKNQVLMAPAIINATESNLQELL